MRPRFSLKWLLIAFTILGVAFYFAFVRPTVLANKLVNLIDRDEFQLAESLIVEPSKPFAFKGFNGAESEPVVAEVRLLPRKWRDLWKMQRRLDVRVIRTRPTLSGNGQNNHLAMQFQATAGVFGVRGSEQYFVSYSPKSVEKIAIDRKRRLAQ
jgi:hypothetical protein